MHTTIGTLEHELNLATQDVKKEILQAVEKYKIETGLIITNISMIYQTVEAAERKHITFTKAELTIAK